MCSNCSGAHPWDEEGGGTLPTMAQVARWKRQAQKRTAMEWMRSNPTIPTERPEVIAEDEFRAKFNLAPRRL